MSQENVERLRGGYDFINHALATGGNLDALKDGLASDLVVEMGVLEGTFHGPDRFIAFLREQASVLDRLHCEPLDFIDAEEHVVVPIRLTGTARSTGLPFVYEGVHVWTVRDGVPNRLRLYDDRDKALEAVALRE